MVSQHDQQPFHILLAYDGSQHASAAAGMLCNLLLPAGSTITVLGVLPPREAFSRTMMAAAVQHIQTLLQRKHISVSTELLSGHPAEQVIEYAGQHHPDLIALGAVGLRQTMGILLGGVAQQVVEYARWPVLVVRDPFIEVRRALLATDGSSYSLCALEYLAGTSLRPRFPLPAGIDLRVIHVLPPADSPHLFLQALHVGPEIVLPVEEIADRLAEEEYQGQAFLSQTLETLKSSGVDASGVLLRGDAAGEILQYVQKEQVDLIVAGSRGLSQVKGWLMGSVSRKLVHYAGCSVLIVKDDLN